MTDIKTFLRQAETSEELAKKESDIDVSLQHLADAFTAITQYVRIESKDQQAIALQRRIKDQIDRKQEERRSIGTYIDKIRSKKGDDEKNIKMTMSLFQLNRTNKLDAIPRGLLPLMFEFIFEENKRKASMTIRSLAARAIQTVIEASSKDESLDLDNPLGKELLDANVSRLIQLLSSSKNEKSTELFIGITLLLSRLAGHQKFGKHQKAVIEIIIQSISVPETKEHKRDTDGEVYTRLGSGPETIALTQRISVSFEAISYLASSGPTGLLLVRERFLPILTSRVAYVEELRRILVASLATITGERTKAPPKKKSIYDGDDPEPEDRVKFKQTVADFIFPALLNTDAIMMRQAAHALCLLLQASPSFGIHVINYVPGSGEEKEEKKQPKIRVMNDDEEEEEDDSKEAKTKEKKPTPNALARLISMAANEHKPTQLLGARCLALASSDTNVRTAVAASGYVDVFYSLIATPSEEVVEDNEGEEDDLDDLKRMTSPNYHKSLPTTKTEKGADWLAGVHAALALGKLAAVGHITPNNAQRYSLVCKMMELVPKVETKESDKKKGESTKKEKKDSKSEKDEKVREIKETEEDELGVEVLQYAVETLAYLSLHIYVKKLLVSQEQGGWLWKIVGVAGHSDPAVRFGVIQILSNLTTSSEDLQKEYDSEVEALKKVARKGLPGADAKREEEQAKKAGSPRVIKAIRMLVATYGGVHGLVNARTAYEMQYGKMKELKEKETKPTKKRSQDEKLAAREKAEEEDKKKKQDGDAGLSVAAAEALSRALVHLATEVENRGRMVSQGALRLCLNLFRHSADKVKEYSALTIAKMVASINPNLYQGHESLIAPLIKLIKDATHELNMFEACLALGNLATINEEMRDRMMKDRVWYELQMLLGDENDLVKRAALQCLTNLVPSEVAMERLRGEQGSQDILLFLVFSQVEDIASQSAATGALAMMSDDEEIAKKIANCELNTKSIDDDDDDDKKDEKDSTLDLDAELADALAEPTEADLEENVIRSESTTTRAKQRAKQRAKAKLGRNKSGKHKTGLSVLKEILADKTTHKDVLARVNFVMANLKKHGAFS